MSSPIQGGQRSQFTILGHEVSKDSIKKIGSDALDSLKKVAISATAFLPCSSRGIIANVIKTPFRLLQSTALGIKEAIQSKSVKDLGSNIAEKMDKYMEKDWHGGIADTDIRLTKGSEKSQKVIEEHKLYTDIWTDLYREDDISMIKGAVTAPSEGLIIKEKNDSKAADDVGQIFKPKVGKPDQQIEDPNEEDYNDFGQSPELKASNLEQEQKGPENIFKTPEQKGKLDIDEEVTLQNVEHIDDFTPPPQVKSETSQIKPPEINEQHEVAKDKILKAIKEEGFEHDGQGSFYSTETGTMFNLVMRENPATKKNEIVLSFYGLGMENYMNINEKDKSAITWNSILQTGNDFLGQVPPSATQAMKLGKILNEATKDSGPTPVVTGFSHGGSLAQCAAVAGGIKGVVFNSQPMGASVRRYLGEDKIAKNNVTAFCGKGDPLSNTRGLNALAVFTERALGIPVPRTVGTSYYVSVDSKKKDNEGFFDIVERKHNDVITQMRGLVE